jgi:hypothetical protein
MDPNWEAPNKLPAWAKVVALILLLATMYKEYMDL